MDAQVGFAPISVEQKIADGIEDAEVRVAAN